MGRFNAIFLSFLFVVLSFGCHAENHGTGTIIVTYQTDQNIQQLDHIRFWLVNEKKERTLYPKKDSFVSNPHARNQRTVVISKLPEGNYSIEFLIPNRGQNVEKVPIRTVEVASGEVIKVNQEIKSIIPSSALTSELLENNKNEPIAALDLSDSFIQSTLTPLPPPTSYVRRNIVIPSPILDLQKGYLSLNTNKTVSWRLMNNGRIVYTSKGSLSNLPVLPGHNYYIVAEELPGYTLRTTPENPFDIPPEASVNVELFYQRDIGFVDIEAILPSAGDSLIISLYPQQENLLPLQANLIPVDGKILWSSGPIGTGEYIITYTLPEVYIPIGNQRFYIEKGLHTILTPQLNPKGTLQVTTETPQATFTLKAADGSVVGQGQGNNYTFKGLDQGYYEISFSSTDTKLYVPPPSQRIFIALSQNEKIKVAYSTKGSLNLSGNVDKFTVNIKSLDTGKTIETGITNRSRQIYLPEGKYTLSSNTTTEDSRSLHPVDVNVKATSPQNVYLSFEKEKSSENDATKVTKVESLEKKANNGESGIETESNILDFLITMEGLDDSSQTKNLIVKDKKLFIPLNADGHYKLVFGPVPHYQVPKPITIEYKKGDRLSVKVYYELGESLLEVPEGIAIIGDPFTDNDQNERPATEVYISAFEISAYPVTNTQYAKWLNDAFQRGTIKVDEAHPGHILAEDGTLLCRTKEANPLAQIVLRKKSNVTAFIATAGKEMYPVIEVTWHGANHYCKDQGLRLPSESQWEKAAGMSLPQVDKPLKRYKYGFGQDTIDRMWANYRYSIQPLKTLQVLTSPIGFYNGRNSLPLSVKEKNQVFTKNAQSPAGAYDMSGNVWEWTSSWNDLEKSDTHKIAKGGCYDSFEDGVRVSERLPMNPDYADIYTGFRTAKY